MKHITLFTLLTGISLAALAPQAIAKDLGEGWLAKERFQFSPYVGAGVSYRF